MADQDLLLTDDEKQAGGRVMAKMPEGPRERLPSDGARRGQLRQGRHRGCDRSAGRAVVQREQPRRELCRNWRVLALRAAVASAFQSLRAEGKYRQPPSVDSAPDVPTTDYDRTRQPAEPLHATTGSAK